MATNWRVGGRTWCARTLPVPPSRPPDAWRGSRHRGGDMVALDLGLDGKRVLVTGASRGIGAAAARAFGEAGCRLALHYHTEPLEAARLAGAALVKGDFADMGDVRRTVGEAVQALGGLDVLVN